MEQLLNAKQVAEKLNISKSSVYSYATQGFISAIKIGKTLRFESHEIDSFIERNRINKTTILMQKEKL